MLFTPDGNHDCRTKSALTYPSIKHHFSLFRGPRTTFRFAPVQTLCAFEQVKTGENYSFFPAQSRKTEKNRKKPVETEEIELTKRLKKPKVNCGTVLPNPHEH
jgi:hypothetical protein